MGAFRNYGVPSKGSFKGSFTVRVPIKGSIKGLGFRDSEKKGYLVLGSL